MFWWHVYVQSCWMASNIYSQWLLNMDGLCRWFYSRGWESRSQPIAPNIKTCPWMIKSLIWTSMYRLEIYEESFIRFGSPADFQTIMWFVLLGWWLCVEEFLNWCLLLSLCRSSTNYTIFLCWGNIYWNHPFFLLEWAEGITFSACL